MNKSLVDNKHAYAIEALRRLRQQKRMELAASWQRRRHALGPALQFANTLAQAGEIQSVFLHEEDPANPCCTLISNSRNRIHIRCESCEREAGRDHELVMNLSVEIVGRVHNPFRAYEASEDKDYRKLFQFVLEWIAELDAEEEAHPSTCAP